MIHKSRYYRRKQRELHIKRKEHILRDIQQDDDECMPVRGTLSKGKVHCSCGCCSFQSYTEQDQRRAVTMLFDIKEADMETVAVRTVARLNKIARNAIRTKNAGPHYSQKTKECFDYDEFLLECQYQAFLKALFDCIHAEWTFCEPWTFVNGRFYSYSEIRKELERLKEEIDRRKEKSN